LIVSTEEEIEARRTVELTVGADFPLSEDIFQNYFENPRNNGGTVDDVRIDQETRVVHVVFEDPEGRYFFVCVVHVLRDRVDVYQKEKKMLMREAARGFDHAFYGCV
jgi:hypothetical protein